MKPSTLGKSIKIRISLNADGTLALAPLSDCIGKKIAEENDLTYTSNIHLQDSFDVAEFLEDLLSPDQRCHISKGDVFILMNKYIYSQMVKSCSA